MGSCSQKAPGRAWETGPREAGEACGWGEGTPAWTPEVVGKAMGTQGSRPLKMGSAGGPCPEGLQEALTDDDVQGRRLGVVGAHGGVAHAVCRPCREGAPCEAGNPGRPGLSSVASRRGAQGSAEGQRGRKTSRTLQWHPEAPHSGQAGPRPQRLPEPHGAPRKPAGSSRASPARL